MQKEIKNGAKKSVDWRKKGGVTVVKPLDFNCNSCTVSAAIGALEGQFYQKTKRLVSFSEKYIIDCNIKTPDLCEEGASLKKRNFFALKLIKKNLKPNFLNV